MIDYNNSFIILMLQRPYVAFCYYNVAKSTIKKFENTYGEGSWENSKPLLKVYKIEEDGEKELQSLDLDKLADNWYICLNESNLDVLVKLGRLLPTGEFVCIATSNSVTAPRNDEDENKEVNYIDVSRI